MRVPQPRLRCRLPRLWHAGRSGLPTALFFFGSFLVAGLVLLAWGPPLLGSLVIVGAVGGLAWTAGLEGLQRLARWLSFGR